MKKYIYAFIGLFLSFVSYAQNKGINYQAVILDPNPIEIPGQSIAGQPLSNGKVCVRFAIMSSTGTTEFQETHKTQTDEYGLVNLVIGGGTTNSSEVISLGNGVYSEFNSIKWDSKVKSLKVSVSFDGCSSFKEIANQPFNYTPYALYAGAVEYKNVEGAPTSLSQFSNDVGYLIPKDLDPVKKDILLTQNNIVSLSEKTDGKFLVVNQQISSIDSTNKSTKEKLKLIDGTLSSHDSRITANDNRITTTDNRITQTNTYVNQQVGGLQTQINTTNTTINQLGVTYEVVSNKSTDTNLGSASPSNELYPSQLAVKSYVDVTVQDAIASGAPDATILAKGKVKLAGDLSGTAESPTVPGLSLKENVSNKSTNVLTDGGSDAKYPSVKAIKDYVDNQVTGSAIVAGTTTQYYRGDKTWQTLDKSAVGLSNVDNTSDAGKPISTAAQSALNLKLAKSDTLSLSNRIDTKQTLANKSTNVGTDASSDIKYPSVKAVKDYVDAQITGSALTAGTTTQYYRGDKTWQTLDKSAVGLSNVDNTSDAGKPISTAAQTALDLKLAKTDTISLSNRIDTKQTLANKSTNVGTDASSDIKYPSVKAVKDYVDAQITGSALTAGTTTQYYRGDKTWQTLDKSAVGLSNVDNTSDAGKPISTAAQTALDLKLAKTDTISLSNRIDTKQTLANKSTNVGTDASSDIKYPSVKAVKDYVDAQITGSALTAGTTTQYYRGDKTWQTLDKSAVGLSNVDNTSDAGKPISTAAQTALNLKENSSNKSDDVNLGVSTSLYPTQNAVKSYVDARVASVTTADGSITNAKIGETLSIAKGGTGATTKSAAFNALSPMTASGDIIYGGLLGSSSVLPKGTDGQVLTLTSGLPSWVNPAATGITSLGGLTGGTQTFATGTTGSDFGISSSGTTHTFNLPDASATARGLVTTGAQTFAGAKTYNSSIYLNATSDGSTNKLKIGTGGRAMPATSGTAQNSLGVRVQSTSNDVMDFGVGSLMGWIQVTDVLNLGSNYSLQLNPNGGNVGIGVTSAPNSKLQVNGNINADSFNSTVVKSNGNNVALGQGNVLGSLTSGTNNVGVGQYTLNYLAGGSENLAMSYSAMYRTSSGNNNVALGHNSMYNLTTGSGNTAIGHSSGKTYTGSNNTFLGYQADLSADLNNATAIGKGAIVNASNKIQLGNTDVTAVATSGKLTTGVVTYPNTDGTSGQVLSTDGSGTVSWTTPSAGGVTTIGSVAGSSTANGATVVSGTLSLAPADGTNPGIVTTGAQTIAGDKTFNGSVSAAAAVKNTEITASFTITSTNASQYNGNVIICNPSSAINITIDNSTTIPTGFNFMVVQKSAAANRVNFVAGTSATIVNRGGNTATAGQYAIATMVHIGNGVFVTSGDML